MTIPTLCLQLDGTVAGQTRDGPYTPAATGAVAFAAGMVEGTQAYVSDLSPAAYLTVNPALIDHTRGTIAVRYWFESGTSQYAISASTATGERLYLRRGSTNLLGSLNALDNLIGPLTYPAQTWATLVMMWDGGDGRLLVNGDEFDTVTATPLPSAITTFRIGAPPSGANPTDGRCAGVLVYDALLTDDELEVIFDTERQWSFDMLEPPSSAPRIHTVLTLGTQHIGPLRVGRR